MLKFSCLLLIFTLNLSIINSSFSQVNLGVNLDGNGAFVNIINQTNRYNKVSSYDSLGWPKSDFELVLLDGRPATEWNGNIDDPEKFRINYSGLYKGSFNGSANVSVSGTSVSIENINYNQQTNTTLFDLIIGGAGNPNHGLVILNFTNTKRVLNGGNNLGITNLIINRPGYPLNTDKLFTNEFIKLCKSSNFSCYRFYNLQNVWDGEPVYPNVTTWNMRKSPYDASQLSMKNMNGKLDGWCWENMIKLANILNKDVWFCIHVSCDSTYVNNLAKLLKDSLNPSINIYIENSNEVWSPTQATHGPYTQSLANKYKISFDESYARRTIELSKWFSNVFGEQEINFKIRVILSAQQAYNGRSDNHLNFIKKTFGEPNKFIYATSTSLYFGSTKATSIDPSIINDGMIEDINNQINNTNIGTYRLNHINKAKAWGFKGGCTSYEGGPSLPEGGSLVNLGNQILSHRTKKMGDVIKNNYIQGWNKIGGGLAMYFTLFSSYNRYGCWGITDDFNNPDRNYKMKAISELIDGKTTQLNQQQTNSIERNKFIETIYPNPVLDNIIVKFKQGINLKDGENITIDLLDITGKLLITMNEKLYQNNSSIKVDCKNYSSGIYTLVFQFNNNIEYEKISIIK